METKAEKREKTGIGAAEQEPLPGHEEPTPEYSFPDDPGSQDFAWTEELESMAENAGEPEDVFETWITEVVRPIWFGPDRKKVRQELTEHFAERQELLMDRGLSWQEASRQAVTMLGDPKELGQLFRRVHHPLLGWMLRGARAVLILLAVFLVVNLFRGKLSTEYLVSPDVKRDMCTVSSWREPYDDTEYVTTVLARRDGHSESAPFSFGPYQVELEYAGFVRTECVYTLPEKYGGGTSQFFREYEIVALRFTGAPWELLREDMAARFLHLEDDLGNKYSVDESFLVGYQYRELYLYDVSVKRLSPGTQVVILTFYDVDFYALEGLSWLDLTFRQGQEEHRLRVRFEPNWHYDAENAPGPLTDEAAAVEELVNAGEMDLGLSTTTLSQYRQAEAVGTDGRFTIPWARQASRDRDKSGLVQCVVEFRGSPETLPLYEQQLREQLRLVPGNNDSGENWTVSIGPQLCYEDTVFWWIWWFGDVNWAPWTLTYTDGQTEVVRTLIPEAGEEAAP